MSDELLPDISALNSNENEKTEAPNILIEGVRITPGNMVFDNAYDGKMYERKFIFQNCGKNPVFIRLCDSNSDSIKFKPFKEGYYLSAGLKIVRNVTFIYKKTMPFSRAQCLIYVNNVPLEYHFTVILSEAVITLEPDRIDFGRIDANCGDIMRKLVIKNTGYQSSHFTIDLGRNDLNLVVEPMKGHVPAKGQVVIQIEVVGWKEGEFEREFWIKTTPPQRVFIYGMVVAPRLLVKKSINRLRFVLLDFKTIYYGSRLTKMLVIKNSSPSAAMFYVVAEIKGTLMSLAEAREKVEDYNQFVIEPEDGRWGAESGSSIRVTFIPQDSKTTNYHICFLRVIRIDCHDLTSGLGRRQIQNFDMQSISESHLNSSLSNHSMTQVSLSALYVGDEDSEDSQRLIITREQSIFVCLHGECEKASVYLRPDSFQITNKILNEVDNRELFIENLSSILPIRVRYRKIPYIDVQPPQFDLKPNETIEVDVVIRACKFDHFELWMVFELFAADPQTTYDKMRKVGINKIRIEFTVNKIKMTHKIKQCCLKTVDKLEPNFNNSYKMNEIELRKNDYIKAYYNSYIRSKSAFGFKIDIDDILGDYSVANKRLLMHEIHKCNLKSNGQVINLNKPLTFIPLRPKELYNVKINPKTINLKKMAPNTSTISSFTIENRNTFPIYVYLMSSKPYLDFDEFRALLQPSEKRTFSFIFSTHFVGKFPARIDVIINMSAVFKITVMVRVMSKCLRIDPTYLEYRNNDSPCKFVSVLNNLNSDTYFDWDLPNEYFSVFPTEGCVPAGRSITCMFTLNNIPKVPDVTEAVITAESGQKRILELCYFKRALDISFNTQTVNVGIIPFNTEVQRRVILKNNSNNGISFIVPDNNPLPGVTISPSEGLLSRRDNVIFTIAITINALIDFETKFTVIVEEEDFVVSLNGSVDIPNITLEPDIIVFRKISPHAIDRAAFKIKNLSKFPLTIDFPMDSYPEFTITKTEYHHLPPIGPIVINPLESLLFFLHFYPQHVTTYTIYLPYVINNIIGPVLNGSSQVTSFLQSNNDIYTKFSNISLLKIRKNLPYIRLNCSAIDKMIGISSVNLRFIYYQPNYFENILVQDLEFTNLSSETVKFCIRIDELKNPFSMQPKNEFELEEHPCSYVVILLEGQKACFEVSFNPVELAHYTQKLAIFVRGHIDEKLYNLVHLQGDYELPEMNPSHNVLYFEPLLPLLKNIIFITIEMKHHLPDCCITADTDLIEIEVEYDRENKPNYTMPVKFTAQSSSPGAYSSTVIFECSCKASCKVQVNGFVDNSVTIATNLASLMKNSPLVKDFFENAKLIRLSYLSSTSVTGPTFHSSYINYNKTGYPFFLNNIQQKTSDPYKNPSLNKYSNVYEYEFHTHREQMENWLFSQSFYCTSFYHIPENFIYHFKTEEVFVNLKKNAAAVHAIPLIQVIQSLTKDDLRNCFIIEEFDGDFESMEYTIYLFNVYSRVIEFCNQLNMYLPLLAPEFLLNYQQYNMVQNIRNSEIIFSESEFKGHSITCWLSLFYQLFRVFILDRYKFGEELKNSYWGDSTNLDFGLCSKQAQLVYDWVLNIYDEDKAKFPESYKCIRNIIYLDENLQDGIILGILTAHYCPYVKSLIDDMYFNPDASDQEYHNACQLIRSWTLLKISYCCVPEDILNLNYLTTIMLLLYLYDYLPSCTPRQSIIIHAPLSTSNNSGIEVENLGNQPITYNAIFFGNEQDLFHIPTTVIRVMPHKRHKIPITFQAKYVLSFTVHLLLSGETPGNRYGKSLCVKIDGISDIVSSSLEESNLTLILYKNINLNAQIQSPYKTQEVYRIFTLNTLKFASDKDLQLASNVFNRILINEVSTVETVANFDENGERTITVNMCCLQPHPRDVYIYYLNERVGDFGVKINFAGKLAPSQNEPVEVFVPDNYNNLICTCKKPPEFHRDCPKIIYIDIPVKNKLLWDGINSIILRDVEGLERIFWEKILHTPIGTRIIFAMLQMQSHNQAMLTFTMNHRVEYNVHFERSSPIKGPTRFVINDVIGEGTVSFPIHAMKEIESNSTTLLRMNEVSGTEKRIYKLVFLLPQRFSGIISKSSCKLF